MHHDTMLCDNLSIKDGVLHFAGMNVVELAKKYGTPLFLLDENKIREKCNIFKKAFKENFGDKAFPLYASKANCFKYIYKIMKDEGMGIDLVSSGEMYTAKEAGFDLSKAYFHGNNKTDEDIEYGVKNRVGYFVVGCVEELDILDKVAEREGIVQKILLRLSPGIDPHTFKAVVTGTVDSKFGQAIETGQAEEIVRYALTKKNLKLIGLHCHIGSQIFGKDDVFERSAEIMLEFTADMKKKVGFIPEQLDLGGGYAVRYVRSDPELNIEEKVKSVADTVKNKCKELNIDIPEIHMEPGRSIVADAGMTLYTVGSVKRIKGYKTYISVDGGMSNNPRHALYNSEYMSYIANKMDEEKDMRATIAGRCCESGDVLIEDAMFPSSVERYDILAALTTGAYHYSMASNYNRLPKPATVMIKDGKDFLVIKRESFEDMAKNEL